MVGFQGDETCGDPSMRTASGAAKLDENSVIRRIPMPEYRMPRGGFLAVAQICDDGTGDGGPSGTSASAEINLGVRPSLSEPIVASAARLPRQ